MSGFSKLIEEGEVTDEELFRHFIFFEKQVGIASCVGLQDIWSGNIDRAKIKLELVNRQLVNIMGLEALSNALINIGREEAEHGFFTRERR